MATQGIRQIPELPRPAPHQHRSADDDDTETITTTNYFRNRPPRDEHRPPRIDALGRSRSSFSRLQSDLLSPPTPDDARYPPPSSTPRISASPEHPHLRSPVDIRQRRLSITSSTRPSPAHSSPASAYFPSQPIATGADARLSSSSATTTKKPPASHSSHGIETSHGPPIALITRASYSLDFARRSPKPVEPPQQQHFRLNSPGPVTFATPITSTTTQDRMSSAGYRSDARSRASSIARRNTIHATTTLNDEAIMSSVEDSSDYYEQRRPQSQYIPRSALRRNDSQRTEGQSSLQANEDLFLNIAQDTPERPENGDLVDRRRSRIARAATRQSLPSNTLSTPPGRMDTRTPSSVDAKQSGHYRSASHLPSPSINPRLTTRERSPGSPATATLDRSRYYGATPNPSTSPRPRESAPPSQLPQYSQRRPSYPDTTQTPPTRTHTYRPSNLYYTSSHDNESNPPVETPPEPPTHRTYPHADGTESVDSGPAPSTVWDELDDLKSRIRKLELTGGSIPATSAAAVSSASGDRPRTATTNATTVSTSPRHARKPSVSPTEASATGSKIQDKGVHPLLHAALAKAKSLLAPSTYRALEAVATEALELAAMTGSTGPQGAAFNAASIINGAPLPDRQLRRKVDNMCRSITELCIELCEGKSDPVSPAVRLAAAGSRRGSLHVNGDLHTPTSLTPQTRASVEPEGEAIPRSSPSRALSRIQARRRSIVGLNGNSSREGSLEPQTPSQSQIPSRFPRAGTSLLRARRGTVGAEDEEEVAARVPSRALTEMVTRSATTARANRMSREYTSQYPLPEKIPSPSTLQHVSGLRRPTVTTSFADNHTPYSPTTSTLLRDNNRRYSERPSALERISTAINTTSNSEDRTLRLQTYSSPVARTTSTPLGRTSSIHRKMRPNNLAID